MVRSLPPSDNSVVSISERAVESHAVSERAERFLKPSTATERRPRERWLVNSARALAVALRSSQTENPIAETRIRATAAIAIISVLCRHSNFDSRYARVAGRA